MQYSYLFLKDQYVKVNDIYRCGSEIADCNQINQMNQQPYKCVVEHMVAAKFAKKSAKIPL